MVSADDDSPGSSDYIAWNTELPQGQLKESFGVLERTTRDALEIDGREALQFLRFF